MEFYYEIAPGAAEIHEEDWNSLSPVDNAYATRGWHLLLEEEAGVRPHYVVAFGAGRIHGILPAFLLHRPSSSFYDHRAVFDEPLRAEKNLPWWPALRIGNRSVRNDLLVGPVSDTAERAEVLRALATGLRELSEMYKVQSAASLYMAKDQADELARALGVDKSGVFAGGVDSEIPVSWSSFDAYLQGLHRDRRYQTRRELRRFADAGRTVSIHPLGEVLDVVTPLLTNLNRKYATDLVAAARNREISGYAHCFPSSAVAFLCHDASGEPVGCSVWLHHQDTLYLRSVGMDYTISGANEYFALTFYDPIKYAIDNRITRIHLGLATKAKIRRRAALRPLHGLVWRPDWDVRGLLEQASDWNSRRQFLGLD